MITSETKILYSNVKSVKAAITGDMLAKAALAGGGVIETYAKQNASRGRPGLNVDTGNLVNSIGTVVSSQSETYAEVQVGTGVEYAAIHEFGGVIMPVTARLLSWIDNGVRIFAKMVQIPARPYLRPAVDEHEKEITAAIEYQIAKQIEQALK